MALNLQFWALLPLISSYLHVSAASGILSYPAYFNFGDSNSDTGGLAAGIAFPFGPPYGQTYFQKPAGRFSDGRLIVDFLMASGGMRFLNPYLDSVGAPNFHTGCNFATGRSTILPVKANAISTFSLSIQVFQFIRFKTRVLEILAKDRSLRRYLPLEDYFTQGLYMFDIGQNDLDCAFFSQTEDQVIASIPYILEEFETRLEELYYEGARNFLVHNTGPLGCLPRVIAKYGKDPSSFDELGCIGSHNRVAKLFNLQLQAICTKFQSQFSEANMIYVDIYNIKLNLISNYSKLGFKQSLAACCGYGGLPLNFDDRIACGQTKELSGTIVTATPCSNTSEYVNWDGNHYTEAANQYISSQILNGKFFDPPSSRRMRSTILSK